MFWILSSHQACRSPATAESCCYISWQFRLCRTFRTIFLVYHSPAATDLRSVSIRGINTFFPRIIFIISNLMHGSNQYASNSPAVTPPRKPSATFSWRAKTKQSNTTLFSKGWNCQKLTWRKRPECNPGGTDHWLIHSSDSSAFSWTFWGSSNMTTLWSLFS